MITIFAMPKAFQGHVDIIQRNAIKSWTRLSIKPEILLLGADEGTAEAAREFGVRHVPEVARNTQGTPLVNDLFAQAQRHAANNLLSPTPQPQFTTGEKPGLATSTSLLSYRK